MKMSRREALVTGTVGALGMLALAKPGRLFAAGEPEERRGHSGKITLLQMNDSHAYLDLHLEWFPGPHQPVYRRAGGYARIATLLKQIRQETQDRVLFLDNGDTFHGTYPVVQSRGETLVPIMNQLKPDAMTVHWDFAYGPRQLQKLASALSYPVLATNIYEKRSGRRFFAPWLLREVSGLRLGIIGIASNIIDKTMPSHFSEGLRFTDGREELPGFINELHAKQGADLIVVLSHLGFPQDMKLLSEVPGVDVLLSGHTHHRLYSPVLQGNTLVIQSGCHGSFLGRLDLEVEQGRVVGHRHELLEVSESIRPDPAVDTLVKAALKLHAAELECVAGEVDTALDRNTTLEATMDNFLLEAVREAAGTPLAFCNGWRWGAPIQAGPVTRNDLYNIIPWAEPISTVELTGRELLDMLEENLERTFSADPFHQLGGYVKRCAGLTAYIKIENPPGTRIQKLFVGSDELQPDQTYRAAYLTVQAVPVKYGRNRKDLPQHAHEAMLAFLKKHKPATAELQGSIVAN
jgi:2',3'-cyclic-nucleotide 2'-phosphodiesterase (5'-nucleotidase family)